MDSSSALTAETNAKSKKAERSARFWASYQVWDAIVTYAWCVFVVAIIGILVAGASFGWNTRTMWTATCLTGGVTLAIYGWGALKLKTYLVIRLFIALLSTAPLVWASYLALHWPSGI